MGYKDYYVYEIVAYYVNSTIVIVVFLEPLNLPTPKITSFCQMNNI